MPLSILLLFKYLGLKWFKICGLYLCLLLFSGGTLNDKICAQKELFAEEVSWRNTTTVYVAPCTYAVVMVTIKAP